METISRRKVVGFGILGIFTGFTGCGTNLNREHDNEQSPTLRVSPGITLTESGWEMEVRVRHTTSYHFSAHNVSIVVFNRYGSSICQTEMGDFPRNGRFENTKTILCHDFPAIVTATAKESPCDGAHIRMVYYTSEKNPANVDDLSHHRFWEGRKRECGEDLPPEHVLEKVQQSGAVTTSRPD